MGLGKTACFKVSHAPYAAVPAATERTLTYLSAKHREPSCDIVSYREKWEAV